jgi:pyridoxal phosphate enzyme (YggS family)
LGENRVQEAEAKVELVEGARWHMLGRLQSNKANRAAQLFEVVHSVDTAALAEKLSKAAHHARDGRPLPIYLQVNVDRDPSKHGLDPGALAGEIATLANLAGLELAGLMTLGRLVDRAEDARPTFRALRELSEKLCTSEPRLGPGLSMGMSDDFEVAVEEGATIVRVGRALFGNRPTD